MTIEAKIENSLLRADATLEEVTAFCLEAKEFGFRAVCIPPCFVDNASQLLQDTDIQIVTVVGFPMGYNTTAAKAEEIKRAIHQGAHEIDAVMNIAAFKSGKRTYVRDEMSALATLCRLQGKKLKIIFETNYLTEEEIIDCCALAEETQVDFVKTSTGFAPGGATPEIVRLLRKTLPPSIKIKASGGIKTLEQARVLLEAGAFCIGTGSGCQIAQEERAESKSE